MVVADEPVLPGWMGPTTTGGSGESTSRTWPAIGCPVCPGVIGPKHAMSMVAPSKLPFTRPTNAWRCPTAPPVVAPAVAVVATRERG